MKSPWLSRCAILVAVGLLALIADIATIVPANQVAFPPGSVHLQAAIVLGVLAFGVAVWLMVVDSCPQARMLGGVTIAICILEALAGFPSVRSALPATAGIAHACLAQMFFAAMVAIAVITSPAWTRGPEFVSDYGWPSMRTLAILTPAFVLGQIILGAGFRQNALTLLPHVLGAMFVALVILMESVFVLQQFPKHRALAPAAKTVLGVAFAQVFLGISALTMKSMAPDTDLGVIIAVASHITGGALTLGATVVLSILIRRNVQPRVEEDLEEPAAG